MCVTTCLIQFKFGPEVSELIALCSRLVAVEFLFSDTTDPSKPNNCCMTVLHCNVVIMFFESVPHSNEVIVIFFTTDHHHNSRSLATNLCHTQRTTFEVCSKPEKFHNKSHVPIKQNFCLSAHEMNPRVKLSFTRK